MTQIYEDRRSGNYPACYTYYQCESDEEYERKWNEVNNRYHVWAHKDTTIRASKSILQLDGINEIGGREFTAVGIAVCLQEGSYTIIKYYIKPNTIK